MRIEAEVLVDRPVEEVFSFTTDFSRIPDWADPVVERVVVTGGPLGVGTRVRAVDEFPGKRVEFVEEIQVWEPNRRVTASMGAPMNGEFGFVFNAVDRGTRVRAHIDANPSGLLGVVMRLMRGKVQRDFQKDLNTLKSTIESDG